MLGYVSGLVELLPPAVLAPIIIYVAIDIAVQAFEATPKRHFSAVMPAFLPAVAHLLMIKLSNPGIVAPDQFAQLLADDSHGIPELMVMVMVMFGNGFIITSTPWATMLVALIDGERGRASAAALLVAAALTAFGIIHSVQPQGALYWPWTLSARELGMMTQWITAFVLAALL